VFARQSLALRKAREQLLRALRAVSRRRVAVTMVIGGTGPEAPALARWPRSGIDKHVRFAGYCAHGMEG